jgi:uncharacterized damage-inducible protein DinB
MTDETNETNGKDTSMTTRTVTVGGATANVQGHELTIAQLENECREALNRLNQAQKAFDEAVLKFRELMSSSSDWARREYSVVAGRSSDTLEDTGDR